ncbi:hypothetical protein HZA76_02555 [Candidatus Roizmanbacteria bacterium]|nr:hypothetical protein [Candidatus Roizmanbacteria bacterium]
MRKLLLVIVIAAVISLAPGLISAASDGNPWDQVWAAIENLQNQIESITSSSAPSPVSSTVFGSAMPLNECSDCELFDESFESSPGPSVTVNITSGRAMVTLTAGIQPAGTPTADGEGRMMFEVTGASSITASPTRMLMSRKPFKGSATYIINGLTNGQNTFTAKYAAFFSSVNFSDRTIIVTPL